MGSLYYVVEETETFASVGYWLRFSARLAVINAHLELGHISVKRIHDKSIEVVHKWPQASSPLRAERG